MGFRIWRFAVAPSDAAEKNCTKGAQLQSLTWIKARWCFGKFTSCNAFGAHKLVHSQPFLDYLYQLWHLLHAENSIRVEKSLYRCTPTVSALKYCSGFFKSLSYVVRTNFYANFWTFRNFWPRFSEFVAPSSDEMRTMYCIWKADPSWKNGENRIKMDP